MSIVEQFRMACQKQNRLATGTGFIIGSFVPVSTFALVHYGVAELPLLWIIVAGGLLFSAKTVFEWGNAAFSNGWKAFGFCVLVEGVMTFGNIFALSVAALAMLAVINGVATGCNLALSQKVLCATRRAKNKPAKPAKPAKKQKRQVRIKQVSLSMQSVQSVQSVPRQQATALR